MIDNVSLLQKQYDFFYYFRYLFSPFVYFIFISFYLDQLMSNRRL